MADQHDEYRVMLINSILFAYSDEQVKRFVDACIQTLDEQKLSKAGMVEFIDRLIKDLQDFNPIDKTTRQWENMMLAKILLKRIRLQLNSLLDK